MPASEQSSTSSGRVRFTTIRAGEALRAFLLLIASLLVIHHRTIFSAFAITEGGGDSMLYNFILEHEWRWLSGEAPHNSLWSPPIFFPQRDTAAYTDLFLAVLPPYAFWRLLGVDPQTAFQLWILTVSVLNYIAAYVVFRLLLGTSLAASSIGAILFAFGSPRLAQIGHPQLLPGFYVIAAFAGLYLVLSESPAALPRRRLYLGLLLFIGGAIAQLYTAFYYAWFMAFSAAVAFLYALSVRSSRDRLIAFLRQWWGPISVSISVAVILVAPAGAVYHGALKDVGPRQYEEVRHFLPNPAAWLAQGPDHWIYGPLNRRAGIGKNFGGQEMFNGIGLVTTVLVLAAVIRFRRRSAVVVWTLVGGTIVVTTLVWPGGFSLWRFVYGYFPAAQAVRAVSRVGVFLLLPATMALALSIDWLADRVSPVAALLCVLAVFAEQAGSLNGAPGYPKHGLSVAAEKIVHQLRPDCKTFLVSLPKGQTSVSIMHLLGMWAQLFSGVPTLNGYSGQIPPGWPLGDVAIANRVDRVRLYASIKSWMEHHGAEIENVCWIAPDVPQAILIRRSDLANGDWFARVSYLELLGRLPAESELPISTLKMNQEALVKNIMDTPEFQGREEFVLAAYRRLFGRDPAYPVWLAAVEDVAAGRSSQAQMVDGWRRSAECRLDACKDTSPLAVRSEVRDSGILLYYCLLRRAPVPAELSDESTSIVTRILNSTEYRQQVP